MSPSNPAVKDLVRDRAVANDSAVDARAGTEFKLTKKANNGILYTLFWHGSMLLARGLARLGITPNLVSCSSFAFWVTGAFLFYEGTYTSGILGAVCYFLGICMDTADGKLARMTDRCSYLGIWLDYNFDSLRYLLLYPPIAIAIFHSTGAFYPIVVAFAAVGIALVTDVLNTQFKQFPFAGEAKREYTKRSPLHRVLRQFYWTEGIETVVLLVAAALDRLEWYLLGWSALLLAKYLAVAFIWGAKIAAADRARKAAAAGPASGPAREQVSS